jgi:hypothetical protein
MNVRKRISIRDRRGVQSTVIATRSPVSRPRLRNHMQRGSPLAARRTNDAKLEHMVEFSLRNPLLLRGKTAEAVELRGTSRDDVVYNVVRGGFCCPSRVSEIREPA